MKTIVSWHHDNHPDRSSTMSSIDVTTVTNPVTTIRDSTIADIFAYAKGPKFGPVEFPYTPTVFATYVDHEPHSHPDANNKGNLVRYANGALTLSPDKKKLSGQMRLWRNIDNAGSPAIFDSPATPPDAFDDPNAARAITITVSEGGQVTYQMNDAKPGPTRVLNAAYVNAIFVETSAGGMRSLSFTLGQEQHEA
jgi:hypothetical protein